MREYEPYYYAYLGSTLVGEGGAPYVYEKALEYCYKFSFNIQQVDFYEESPTRTGLADKIPIDTMRKLVYKNDH